LGGVISEYVVLRDPKNNEFEVRVVNKLNELFFTDGWSVLDQFYDISFGAWIYVTYVSPQLMSIRIATRWGAEITYPVRGTPVRHVLMRHGAGGGVGSSLLVWAPCVTAPSFSLIYCCTKKLTFYDVHSGNLVFLLFLAIVSDILTYLVFQLSFLCIVLLQILPWYDFGLYAFAFVFSKLIMKDTLGNSYECILKFDVDVKGTLCCKVSLGWVEVCAVHRVMKGDKAMFKVNHRTSTNVMHVSICPKKLLHVC
jgi:hypothetical protein